jgi:hypothetical protein
MHYLGVELYLSILCHKMFGCILENYVLKTRLF